MPKEQNFKVTEYESFDLTSSVRYTTVKAKNINDGIKKFLDLKSTDDSKYILCSILQTGEFKVPFKHFTFGERKRTHVSEYVTNVCCARIEQTK